MIQIRSSEFGVRNDTNSEFGVRSSEGGLAGGRLKAEGKWQGAGGKEHGADRDRKIKKLGMMRIRNTESEMKNACILIYSAFRNPKSAFASFDSSFPSV